MSSSKYWDVFKPKQHDELNEMIWRNSPSVQMGIQTPDQLDKPGSVGAQQAMLDREAASKILPWVPDLVGESVGDDASVLVIGPHYSGFIREYSRRMETLPLEEYLGARNASAFVKAFVAKVVRLDGAYYQGIAQLVESRVEPKHLAVMDLCRASFVRRGKDEPSRRDESSEDVVREGRLFYARYVEDERPRDWTLRRIRESNAQVIIAIGNIAEHGLLRIIDSQGARVTDARSGHRLRLLHTGKHWTAVPADKHRTLRYWLSKSSWWETHIDGRPLFILPVHQPFRAEKEDPRYQRTGEILSNILQKARPRHYGVSSQRLYLGRYRPIQLRANSEFSLGEDLVTGRKVFLKIRDLPRKTSHRVVEREVQMLSLLDCSALVLCTDYGREGGSEVAAYEHHQKARCLSEVLRKPGDREPELVGPDARFDTQCRFLQGLADAVYAMHFTGIVHGAIDENTVWVWPAADGWACKLAGLDKSATKAVSLDESSATETGDIQAAVRIVRSLLTKTRAAGRNLHWRQIDAFVSKVEKGESVDADDFLDAFKAKEVTFEDLVSTCCAHDLSPEDAHELAGDALRSGRVGDLPAAVFQQLANSFPARLSRVVGELTSQADSAQRSKQIGEILKILGASPDIDAVHRQTCERLLELLPKTVPTDMRDQVYELGARFHKSHPGEWIEPNLTEFSERSFHAATSREAELRWYRRLRDLKYSGLVKLRSKFGQDLPADQFPRNREAPQDLSKVVSAKRHHIRFEVLMDWAEKVCDKYTFVWNVRSQATGWGLGDPRICQPEPDTKNGLNTYKLPVILGERYHQEKKHVEVIIIFAPETTQQQALRAKEELEKDRDLLR